MQANRRKLTPLEKLRMMEDLKGRCLNGFLPRGSMAKVAERFGVHHSTVKLHWQRHQNGTQLSKIMSHGLVGNTNRAKYDQDALLIDLTAVPIHLRSTQRSLSKEMGVSTMVVSSLLKDKKIKNRSSFLKPKLKDYHQLAWLHYIASLVINIDLPTRHYNPMYNRVFIDEKWFYRTVDRRNYYLHPDEITPHRTAENKRFVEKIMFLVAVARPRTLADGAYWDGRIGCWPFGKEAAAQRTSPRRAAGTLEFANSSVTRDATRRMMIDEVLLAIVALAPLSMLDEPIFIQQDNAPAHFKNSDPEWQAALLALGQGALQISLVQ